MTYKRMQRDSAVTRPIKAALICAAALAIAAVSLAVPSFAATGAQTTLVSHIWNDMNEGNTIEEALKEVGAMVLTDESVESWMREELMGSEWLNGAIADASRSVIWITREGAPDEVREALEIQLSDNEWNLASRDVSESFVDTFMKREGECRWILAEYAQSGKDTIVVLHIERN